MFSAKTSYQIFTKSLTLVKSATTKHCLDSSHLLLILLWEDHSTRLERRSLPIICMSILFVLMPPHEMICMAHHAVPWDVVLNTQSSFLCRKKKTGLEGKKLWAFLQVKWLNRYFQKGMESPGTTLLPAPAKLNRTCCFSSSLSAHTKWEAFLGTVTQNIPEILQLAITALS